MKEEREQIVPFLKWAGGKRWFNHLYSDLFPGKFRRYCEPFLGSAAVYFHLQPQTAVLSDINRSLIGAYEAIRDDWQRVERILRRHQLLHSDDYYYFVRNQSCASRFERAARFIYLNRTCWNGLYRVNQEGRFNVPRGTKDSVILPTDQFKETAKSLQNADLECCDFEESINKVGRDDFVFIDPPYTVKHNFNGFIKYNERLFSWLDQERLHACAKAAVSRGAKVIVTNANHESVWELYSDFPQKIIAPRESVLAADKSSRNRVQELIIRSW